MSQPNGSSNRSIGRLVMSLDDAIQPIQLTRLSFEVKPINQINVIVQRHGFKNSRCDNFSYNNIASKIFNV